MTPRACISVVFACGFGGLGAGCGVGGDDPFEPEPIDPNPERIVCTDGFKLAGTFQVAATPTPDPETDAGCWPAGTWTFTAALDPTDDQILDITGDGKADRCGKVTGTAAAAIEAGYSFTVTRTAEYIPGTTDVLGWTDAFRMSGSTIESGVERWNSKIVDRIKVSQGGAGSCQGSVELYSADRKELWILKPYLAGAALAGLGEYTRFEEARL